MVVIVVMLGSIGILVIVAIIAKIVILCSLDPRDPSNQVVNFQPPRGFYGETLEETEKGHILSNRKNVHAAACLQPCCC